MILDGGVGTPHIVLDVYMGEAGLAGRIHPSANNKISKDVGPTWGHGCLV